MTRVSGMDVGEFWWPRHPNGIPIMECFLCAEDVALSAEHEAIFWSGGGEGILLHPRCAINFAFRLICDATRKKEWRIAAFEKPIPGGE